ncbi:MAG: alpha-L-fucosidase [Clostridia bacterium]|nr:alpha-L-fucosidase [Clostridia bacterium]
MDNKTWFKEAKFGMMIHFGLYSILGGEWKGKRTDQIGEWAQSFFRIPNSEYHRLAEIFNPIYFDAEEWVKTAKDAGMKYFVITSKHHDGFALFKSEASSFNVVDATPFKRDIIAEIAEACYKHGLKLGLYYSQALDWAHPHGSGYRAGCYLNCGVMDWGNTWDFPDFDKKDYKICYEEKIKPQVKEILTNYGDLCLIWFDTPINMPKELSVELYDMVKHYQPDCLINSRLGHGVCDYESAGDNEIPEDKKDMLFETPATLNDTWGYKSFDQNWKSAKEVIRIKNHLNERGINYLLNVGPDHLGRFPAPATEILLEVGKTI